MMMTMMKLLAGLALALPLPAAAHEIWVERDAHGPARIYLGEPAEVVPEAGDPEFHRLQNPQLLATGGKAVTLVRRANHIEAAVPGKGDVRVKDDTVFAPWKSGEQMQGAIFYARAGRAETKGTLDLELVPVRANGDRFTLLFRGEPVKDVKVHVIAPDRSEQEIATDAQGQIDIPQQGKGRYIAAASHTEQAAATIGGQPVDSVMHVSTISFVR
jgi:Nickel uptake substrate-specific transmembrane region.